MTKHHGLRSWAYRRGELQLDAVRVCERQYVDAERQAGDLAMADAALVEQPGRLLQFPLAQ
jgi:hypothetical protein